MLPLLTWETTFAFLRYVAEIKPLEEETPVLFILHLKAIITYSINKKCEVENQPSKD